MTKAVIVVPYIYQPFYDDFLATYNSNTEKLKLLPINNTEDNIGVAESWNLGVDYMRKTEAKWLIICSATIRFGKDGLTQMLDQLKQHPYAHMIYFAKRDMPAQNFDRDTSPPYDAGVFYWHLTAVRADVFDKVGYFDPNFYPIYFEDTDFDLRFNKAYADSQRLILPLDATSAGLRHGVEKTGLKVSSEPGIAYFATKWGRHPSAPQLGEYNRPFNDDNNSLAFFPPAHGRLWNG